MKKLNTLFNAATGGVLGVIAIAGSDYCAHIVSQNMGYTSMAHNIGTAIGIGVSIAFGIATTKLLEKTIGSNNFAYAAGTLTTAGTLMLTDAHKPIIETLILR